MAQFVPIVGPIAAAAPALVVAATGGMQMLLLTLALFVGGSQLEANLITPLVQKNVAARSPVGTHRLVALVPQTAVLNPPTKTPTKADF